MKKLNNLVLRVKNSKLSNENKKRVLAGIMAGVMLLSSSGCSMEDNIDFSNITIKECIELVRNLTNLDEFLENTNFYDINEEYIKARKAEDIKKISETLPKLYDLVLEGTIVDTLIENGKLDNINQVKNIEIVTYEDDKTYCNIKYVDRKESKTIGKITLGADVCKNLKIEINKNICNMRNDINNKDNLSLVKADYGYRRCMECVSGKGNFTGTKLGEFYLKQDSKKVETINNRALENNGKRKIFKK